MATGGNYLFRELEQSLNQVLEPRYRNLKHENGTISPVIPDLEVGAAEVVAEIFNEVGEAAVLGDGAIDIPIVDVSSDEDRYKIFRIGAALSFTHDQERAQVKSRKSVMARKQRAVSRAIAEQHNRVGAYGHAGLGVTGFLNNPNVTAENASFNFFTATDNDTIVSFFVDRIRDVYNSSNAVEEVNEVVIPPEIHYELIGRRMDSTGDTLLGYIKKALSEEGMALSMVKDPDHSRSRMPSTVGTANKHRITFCAKDEAVVSRHIEITKLLPEDWMEVRNGRKIYPYASYTTPVIVHYPGAMRYVDVPIS